MRPGNERDRIEIAFDDHRLVANAGLILPVTLAHHLGLGDLVDDRVDLGDVSGRVQVLRNRPELGETEPLVHLSNSFERVTAYTDREVEPGVMYVYRVRSIDMLGYLGEMSQPVEIRTAAAQPGG